MRREEKLLDAFCAIDEKYIKEAEPNKMKAKSIFITVAACVVIVCTAAAVMLLGGKDTPTNPTVAPMGLSDFELAMRDYFMSSVTQGGDVLNDGSNGSSPNGGYLEVTDNQVEGVVEADKVKATDRYIFRIGEHNLYIYSKCGEDSELVSQLNMPLFGDEIGTSDSSQLFLSSDGCTVTIFKSYRDFHYDDKIGIITIDVSDVSAPREINRVNMYTNGSTVRRIDNKFYLITSTYFERNKMDLDNPESYMPSFTTSGGKHVCDMSKVVYPENISSVNYRYLTVFEEGSLELVDEMALMGVGSRIYFTSGSILFDYQYYKSEIIDESGVNRCYSKIGRVDISDDNLSWGGYITVEGWAKDRFSFDEKDGYLRMVVSTSDRGGYTTRMDSASVYVYNLTDNTLTASVEKFAPYGEGVTSARFDGDMLYVCTAETVTYTDPVYFFDLSDYSNITYADTGVIEGFSTSLIQLNDGYLLGIGVDSDYVIKIEVYKQEGDSVVSVDQYTFRGIATDEYKSLLVNRDENMFGVPYFSPESRDLYLIVRFNGESIEVVSEVEMLRDYTDKHNFDEVRCFVNEGYAYITTDNELIVVNTDGEILERIHTNHTFVSIVDVQDNSCTTEGLRLAECSCGITYSLRSGMLGHTLEGDHCSSCGALLTSVDHSDKIIFTSLGDGTCIITGTKEKIYGELVIPMVSPKGDIVIEIGSYAFTGNVITKLTVLSNVKKIGSYAFESGKMTEVKLLNGVEIIGNGAFSSCQSLETITLPNSLKSIGEDAFWFAKSLTYIEIPDSVTEIGEGALSYSGLKSVKLPKNLTKISAKAFQSCVDLESVIVPDSVTEIGSHAFQYCINLTSIVIPDRVVSIGTRAFYGCRSITKVVIGASVGSIGEFAFENCSEISEVINFSNLDIQQGSSEHGGVALNADIVTKK